MISVCRICFIAVIMLVSMVRLCLFIIIVVLFCFLLVLNGLDVSPRILRFYICFCNHIPVLL